MRPLAPNGHRLNRRYAVQVEAGEDRTAVDIDLQTGGVITATLTDATTGQPVGGACLEPIPTSAGPEDYFGWYGCSDETGVARVGGLPEDSYFVQVRSDTYEEVWFDGALDRNTATPVDVTTTESAQLDVLVESTADHQRQPDPLGHRRTGGLG